MNLTVLNTNLEAIAVLDVYESLIWTDRYSRCGDFELYSAINEDILSLVKQDYYIVSPESDHVMIVEDIRIETDPENGDHIRISGNSLEKILDRRIIWGRTIVSGSLQNVVRTLLNECIITPTDSARKIDNFIFEESTDPSVTGLSITSAQYTGDNLYDIIVKNCSDKKLGFQITLNSDMQFVFKLYAGTDRSYNQSTNPYVVFSPSFDNLLSANYMETKSALKTVALIGGAGEGDERLFRDVNPKGETGIHRREVFINASDLSAESVSDEDYANQMDQRALEKLAEHTEVSSFEGQAETRTMFKYGEDFFAGDIVQFADAYGHEAPARIIEVITSNDKEGLSVYPTFEMIKEGD